MSLLNSYKTIQEYRRDPLLFFHKLFLQNGHRSNLEILGKRMILLSHPEDVTHVLKTNNQAYTKGRTTRELRIILGDGLITKEGEGWKQQHRLIRPIMSPKSVFGMASEIDRTVQDFSRGLTLGTSVDSFHEMNRLTWRIVLKTLFSQEATAEMDAWLKDILFVMESVTKRTRSVIKTPYWFPTPDNLRAKSMVGEFHRYVEGLIKERRLGKRENDLLQLLLDIRDEEASSAQLSEGSVKDEILTFLMAGHETITNTLSWALIALAQHPRYLGMLRKEADEFFETNDYQKLNAAPWHTAVIDEVMRLWPPVWAFMRLALEDDVIKDLRIPKNSNVIVSPYLTHRAPDFWEDAETFMPERFLPSEKKLVSGQFYPYGLGPRACIGAHFAGLEAKIILAHFSAKFDWAIEGQAAQTYEAGITLRPLNNTCMIFKRR